MTTSSKASVNARTRLMLQVKVLLAGTPGGSGMEVIRRSDNNSELPRQLYFVSCLRARNKGSKERVG